MPQVRSSLPGIVLFSLLLLSAPVAWADEVIVAPGSDGGLGAWLVAGPFFGGNVPFKIETEGTETVKGRVVVANQKPFRLVATSKTHFDVAKLLRARANGTVAIFAGVLRASAPTRVQLILGVDDDVAVHVDGRRVYERKAWRPPLRDDDAAEFEVTAGDHPLIIRLRQRSQAWRFRARLLAANDLRPPRTVAFVLPEANKKDSLELATKMIAPELQLMPEADHYRAELSIPLAGGLPVPFALPIHVSASASPAKGASRDLFRVSLGSVARTPRSVMPLRALLPAVPEAKVAEAEKDGALQFEVQIGKKIWTFRRPVRQRVRLCIARIDEALSALSPERSKTLVDPAVVEATLRNARDRLVGFIASGDKYTKATEQEAEQVSDFVERLLAGQDPLLTIKGEARLAYSSALDGNPRPFGVYVPHSFRPEAGKKYPLVVVLHGLNGLPMHMIRIFFGKDRPGRRAWWKDRHPIALPKLDAFVVSPSGFGNLSYREAGEVDVMALREWMMKTYPIEAQRVYVTGASMGGTGTAAVALRFPDRFAAAAPLCGYHSYALRRDMSNRKLRPWETALREYWSNVSWAENGRNLPLYVVHGNKDLPIQNSGVLIDRYKRLGYPILDEHPDVGHNVWQMTYEHKKAYRWLHRYTHDPEPKQVVLKTSSLRYADNACVHAGALTRHLSWGIVRARVTSPTSILVTTKGVTALRLDRPVSRVDASKRVEVKIDGQVFDFGGGRHLDAHRVGETWKKGALPGGKELSKRAGLSGPIRDAFLEPLIFVVGTRDPAMTGVNYEVAKSLAEPPFGIEARWPVLADVDLVDTKAASHSLVLIGNARSNSYVARINDRLPLRVDGNAVVAGGKRFEGEDVGTMFIYPNPLHPDRYVLVIEAPTPAGVLRALSLPRLLPDFVVYDSRVAKARGQMVLGSASLRAGGLFDQTWKLPQDLSAP